MHYKSVWYPQRTEDVGSLRLVVIDDCEAATMCSAWDLNLGLGEEQPVPSLSPQEKKFHAGKGVGSGGMGVWKMLERLL